MKEVYIGGALYLTVGIIISTIRTHLEARRHYKTATQRRYEVDILESIPVIVLWPLLLIGRTFIYIGLGYQYYLHKLYGKKE